ncbi:MAG: nicotinate-nucleotide--dimethylbenzimidazole phosphoribosyltransferase [Clostridiales bacterium]|nr:nicotinate-nucleotide--dimethylbenzimidazole phosphoribosyltransferase [Clostridiales bacterium]
MKLLEETLKKIGPIDKEMIKKSRKRVDSLIKPVGSMGRIEEFLVQLSGIKNELYPEINKKAIVIMCADHGVIDEGVAISPATVTLLQTINFAKGYTGVCALAKQAGADIVPVDIGVFEDVDHEGVINKKIRYGTNNMRIMPAMSYEEAIKSLEIGIEIVQELKGKGYDIVGTGEMGICNTTPSSAIISVLGNVDPAEVTGIGANLPEEKILNKIQVIKDAIKNNNPDPNDPIDVLAKVGGFEIGGMAGVMIAGAANRIPVIVDGFISTAAALIACSIEPKVKEYLIPSHKSIEKGAKYASELLGLEPVLDLDMRLGEGTGSAIMFNIIEGSILMNKNMITFEEVGIDVV